MIILDKDYVMTLSKDYQIIHNHDNLDYRDNYPKDPKDNVMKTILFFFDIHYFLLMVNPIVQRMFKDQRIIQ